MSAQYFVCPYCQAGNPAGTATCWMCCSALPSGVAMAAGAPGLASTLATAPQQAAAPTRGATPIAWSATLIVSVLLSLAISAELARVAPGVLVLFLFVDLPVIGALLVTVVKMWAGDGPATDAGAARTFAVRAVKGVAIGVGGVFALLASLFLLAVALTVIAFVICLALAAGSSHF